MTSYVITDVNGTPVSIGTVLSTSLPAGHVANLVSDADYAAIVDGRKRWRNGAVEDTNFAAIQANLTDLQAKIPTALTANGNYLAIPTPTNIQVAAQVTALTRQVNALGRLTGNILDSTAGT